METGHIKKNTLVIDKIAKGCDETACVTGIQDT